jgi:hypothetical protein
LSEDMELRSETRVVPRVKPEPTRLPPDFVYKAENAREDIEPVGGIQPSDLETQFDILREMYFLWRCGEPTISLRHLVVKADDIIRFSLEEGDGRVPTVGERYVALKKRYVATLKRGEQEFSSESKRREWRAEVERQLWRQAFNETVDDLKRVIEKRHRTLSSRVI